MSSIDDRNAARAARVFDEAIAPLRAAAARRAHGAENGQVREAHPADARPAGDSYFTPVAPFERLDFELATTGDPAHLEAILRALWQSRPELLPVAAALAGLSAELEAPETQALDVSPFVYVMF